MTWGNKILCLFIHVHICICICIWICLHISSPWYQQAVSRASRHQDRPVPGRARFCTELQDWTLYTPVILITNQGRMSYHLPSRWRAQCRATRCRWGSFESHGLLQIFLHHPIQTWRKHKWHKQFIGPKLIMIITIVVHFRIIVLWLNGVNDEKNHR